MTEDQESPVKPLPDFQLLKDLGVLSQLDKLQTLLLDDEVLLDDAKTVFRLQDAGAITDYMAQKLLNRFVPSYLTFILEDEIGSEKPRIICFRNTKPIESPVEIPDLEPYRHFFSLSPQAVDFRVFEYMVGKASLTDPFLVLNPSKVIPLLGLDGVYGFIIVGKKILGDTYTEQETAYLDRLINFGSISLQNSLHFRRAIVDLKTELYNHSFFMKRLEEELARLRRYKSRTTLLMLDVDHFKKFNDTYGHLAGDWVLKEVSKAIRDNIRLEDLAARFGGEEFAVLLIQCDPDKGYLIGERIREAIAERHVVFGGRELSVTVSIGVSHTSTEGLVPDSATFIDRADQALYVAKRSGRNRTSVYDPEAASSVDIEE
jgi:diguanylate cyclase (GGDEF)-like protein